MNEPLAPRPRSRHRVLWPGLVALALLVAGSVAVYGIMGLEGNAGACDTALKTAAKLDDFRKGDMAGFLPAREALDFSGLTFAGPDGMSSIATLKGRVLLVNLWATWCVPCRAEMPALDALQAAKAGPDFTVVAVNLDLGGDEKRNAFFATNNITHLARYADHKMGVFNAVKQQGLALGLPTSLLLDRKGCLIGSLSGPAAWNDPAATGLVTAAINSPL